MTPTPPAPVSPAVVQSPSSQPPPADAHLSPTIVTPIAPVTSSNASGAGSRTGDASQPDTTNSPETSAPAHSSQPQSSIVQLSPDPRSVRLALMGVPITVKMMGAL